MAETRRAKPRKKTRELIDDSYTANGLLERFGISAYGEMPVFNGLEEAREGYISAWKTFEDSGEDELEVNAGWLFAAARAPCQFDRFSEVIQGLSDVAGRLMGSQQEGVRRIAHKTIHLRAVLMCGKGSAHYRSGGEVIEALRELRELRRHELEPMLAAMVMFDEAMILMHKIKPYNLNQQGAAVEWLSRLKEFIPEPEHEVRWKKVLHVNASLEQLEALERVERFEELLTCSERLLDGTELWGPMWSVRQIMEKRIRALQRLGHLEESLVQVEDLMAGDNREMEIIWCLEKRSELLGMLGRAEEARAALREAAKMREGWS